MTDVLLRAFVVGSCGFVVIPFFIAVLLLSMSDVFHVSHLGWYMVVAPLYLGILNAVGALVQQKFPTIVTNDVRYIATAVVGATLVTVVIVYSRFYPYKTISRWSIHIIALYLWYLVIFMVIIKPIEKYFFVQH